MTTPGFRIESQAAHMGTRSSRNWVRTVPSDATAPQARQSKRRIEPCSSTTSELPARWWSASMFCVATVCTYPSRSSSASARWPGFGTAEASIVTRGPYQLHTRRGSLRKASIEATS